MNELEVNDIDCGCSTGVCNTGGNSIQMGSTERKTSVVKSYSDDVSMEDRIVGLT